jgi:hypothetical protein
VLRDLTVAPDHRPNCATAGGCRTKLYVAVDNLIERMDLDGTGVQTVFSAASCAGTATAPSGVRVNSSGAVVFNSASGAWVIPAAGGCPTQIAGTSGGAGLASAHNGDLLVSVGNAVKIAPLTPSGYGTAVGLATPIALVSPILGLAVDTANRIIVATASSLTRYVSSGAVDPSFSVSFGGLRAAYIETRIDPAQYLYVSLADADGQNGQVVRVSDTGATTLIATLPKVSGKFLGAVGVGIHPGRRDLTHDFTSPTASHLFDFGFSRFGIGGETIVTNCAVKVTAVSQQPQLQRQLFLDSGVNVSSIPQSGQQGFSTRYQVTQLSTSDCLGEVHTSWSGYFEASNYPQPGMGREPDACVGPSPCAHVLSTFYFSPVGPLPGDPIIENFTRTSGFMPINIPLSNNFTLTWLPPMGNNPPQVINKSGSGVASFKFRLLDNGVVISDQVAATVTTVFSVAAVPFNSEESAFPGLSIKEPPAFVYDTQDNLFRYNLDVSLLAPGKYVAIVLSNSTPWTTLEFCVETCSPAP